MIENKRNLDKNVNPVIGHKKMNEVKRWDIIFLLDQIHDRGPPVAANRVFRVVSRMFNFSLERGVLESPPETKIKLNPKQSRDQVLTRPEIKTLFYLLTSSVFG